MNDDSAAPGKPVSFGAGFASSKVFAQVFKEGMSLVEETAGYLDGTGREQSRQLTKTAALAYATESMRLTTRLMQVASWLLIQRAVAEGEMPASEAYGEAGRVPLKPPVAHRQRPFTEELPDLLLDLVQRTDRIYARLYRLDMMLDPAAETPQQPENVVAGQLEKLRAAFKSGDTGED